MKSLVTAVAIGSINFSLAVCLCLAMVKQLEPPDPADDLAPGSRQVGLDAAPLPANEATANQPRDEESEKTVRKERNKRIGMLPRFVSYT